MRSRLIVLATLLAVTSLGATVLAQTPGSPKMTDMKASTSDRAAIEALIAEEDAAWAAGDAAAFSARTTPDVVFTNIVGMFSVGRAPFEAQHAKIFSTIYKGSRVKQTLVNISFVRPDVAIVDTLTELTGFAHLPPGAEAVNGALHTRLEQVMVREGAQWSVAAFHNVVVNPSVK